MIEILGQTTLENGKVLLRTSVGNYIGTERNGLSAIQEARELMLREHAKYAVSVADSLADRKAGNASVWRGRENYGDAKHLALLYMARNHLASIAIIERGDAEKIVFTNNPELCQIASIVGNSCGEQFLPQHWR